MKPTSYIQLFFLLILICFVADVSAQRNVYVSINNTKEINVPEENYISSLDAGAVFGKGRYFFAGAGVSVAKVWGAGYSSLGVGVGPDVQINIFTRTKFKLFLEGKGRVMYLFPEYPGTELNFAFWGGPSVEFLLSGKCHLKLGTCYNHLSNGKEREQEYNKSLDGLGLNIGLAFY